MRADYAAQLKGLLEAELTQAVAELPVGGGGGRLRAELTQAVAQLPVEEDLFASIVSIGCGVPRKAVVSDSFQGVVIQASPSPVVATAAAATTTATTVAVAGPPSPPSPPVRRRSSEPPYGLVSH